MDDEDGGDTEVFGWTRVVFADDLDLCKCCDVPFCHKHNKHFCDCECIGPTQDDMDYKFIDDIMFARKKPKPPPDLPEGLHFFRML
jgi:hypothetical protein